MDIKGIIREQREELEHAEKDQHLVAREGLEEAKKALRHPNILAVLGIRRCGKSIFSYLLAKEKVFGYINFDDERLIGLKPEDLNKILESFYELYGDIEYIVLDELQNIKGWELFVNRLRRTKKVIVTGSNSRLLSGELATHLTGRHLDMTLFPFSFREMLRYKKVDEFTEGKGYTTKEKAELLRELREYLEFGGFPEVAKFGKNIIAKIYEDIITKDILLRYQIKKKEDLKKLAKYLTTNAGSEYSYSKLAKILGIKHIATISNWISYLENAYLLFKVDRFAYKLKQQFTAPKKVYCIDSGAMSAIGFRFSENIGHIMENVVFIELKRMKEKENEIEIYYWKDHQQHEVDFVIKKQEKIEQLIQVSCCERREEVEERRIRALLKAGKELKCKNLRMITWDYEAVDSDDGRRIDCIPLWKWLLDKAE